MAIKVRVRDFQSLGDVSFEIDGLTVVTGANNTGKSALVRAVRGAFQNTRGTGFVRHGKTKAIVDVDFGDGHSLTWEKGKGKDGKPTYTIDKGKPFHPGQGVPPEVRALNVKPITAGGHEVWPQIAPQFQQVFLLDQPGSVMAEAVADLERVSQLNEALRLAMSDLRSSTAELNTRRSDLASLEGDLKRFEGLDDVAAEVAEIEAKAALAKRVETALLAMQAIRERLAAARSTVTFYEGIEGVEVPTAGEVDGLRTLIRDRDDLVVLQGRLTGAQGRVAALRGIEDVKIPEDESFESVRTMSQQVRDLTVISTRMTAARSRFKALEGIEGVEVADPTTARELARELDETRELAQRHKRAKAQVERLEKADLSSVVVDTAGVDRIQTALQVVTTLRDHLTSARSRVSEAERELATAQAELDQATTELTDTLGPQCPYCDSILQPHGAHA